MIGTRIDLSELIGLTITKTLEWDNTQKSPEEIQEFAQNLLKDEDFIECYKNIIKTS